MSITESKTDLRLVGVEDPWTSSWRSAADTAIADVTEENRNAYRNQSLDPTDPRWVLAVRTNSQLQGTTLTYERRQRLMRTAEQLGVRPFDANIIIAIVQDHARRGVTLSYAAGTLALLGPTGSNRSTASELVRWFAAAAAGLTGSALLIWWLTSV